VRTEEKHLWKGGRKGGQQRRTKRTFQGPLRIDEKRGSQLNRDGGREKSSPTVGRREGKRKRSEPGFSGPQGTAFTLRKRKRLLVEKRGKVRIPHLSEVHRHKTWKVGKQVCTKKKNPQRNKPSNIPRKVAKESPVSLVCTPQKRNQEEKKN